MLSQEKESKEAGFGDHPSPGRVAEKTKTLRQGENVLVQGLEKSTRQLLHHLRRHLLLLHHLAFLHFGYLRLVCRHFNGRLDLQKFPAGVLPFGCDLPAA